MARAWRLRHKLVVGLALVVGSVALLLGGALFGLSSYADTMAATNRNLDDMMGVAQVRDAVQKIGAPDPAGKSDGATQFEADRAQAEEATRNAEAALARFKASLQADGRHGLDPDGREEALARIAKMEQAFVALRAAIDSAAAAGADAGPSVRLADVPRFRDAHKLLTDLANELFSTLVADSKRAFERTDANSRRALYLAAAGTALAVLMVATLLYYFGVWVFSPIRQLQAGVRRVHTGDFEHPIRLASNDELEELANEFNAMTARLRDVYADLARQVEDRSTKLVAAEKMVSIGFLAAGVAHEINNPMASIAFCAEALERRLQPALAAASPQDADVIVKYLKMIEQEAFRCKQITDRLLNYSRSGTGRRETVDLAEPVQNQLDLLRHHPEFRDRRMEFRHDGPVPATVDAHEFEGVIHNLVVNALEHTDPGGTVSVTLRAAADGAEVVVRDTGAGMTADVLKHLFEPFYTRSRTGTGTGLGLFMVKRAVTDHGGTIVAHSDGPGRGSTFTVRLPLREARSERREARGEPEPVLVPFPGVRAAA